MKYSYLAIWGVPCCERFSRESTKRTLQSSHHLEQAKSSTQADLMLIFGSVSKKQTFYVQNLWSDFVFPAFCIHFNGCDVPFTSYAVAQNLSEVISADLQVHECDPNKAAIEAAIASLGMRGDHA